MTQVFTQSRWLTPLFLSFSSLSFFLFDFLLSFSISFFLSFFPSFFPSSLSTLLLLQLKKVRSLLLAGAAEFDGFPQQLRLMEAAFKLSAKDLRSQVVREACITLGWERERIFFWQWRLGGVMTGRSLTSHPLLPHHAATCRRCWAAASTTRPRPLCPFCFTWSPTVPKSWLPLAWLRSDSSSE